MRGEPLDEEKGQQHCGIREDVGPRAGPGSHPLPTEVSVGLWNSTAGIHCVSFFFSPTRCLNLIGVLLVYSVVLVSGVQQSESVTHISILFQSLFPHRLSQSIE